MARFSSKLWVLIIKFDIVPHCIKCLKWSISKRHIYSLELCQQLTPVPGNPNCRSVGDSFHCFLMQSPFLSGHWEGSASSSAGSTFTTWFSLDNGVKKGAVDATQAPRNMLRNMLLLKFALFWYVNQGLIHSQPLSWDDPRRTFCHPGMGIYKENQSLTVLSRSAFGDVHVHRQSLDNLDGQNSLNRLTLFNNNTSNH